MIERDIVNHIRKTFTLLKSSGKNVRHKVIDILIEILIIIVAVTTSIWLNNWSESLHDQKEEHEFLAGLKIDLQNNIQSMESSNAFYRHTIQGIDYFSTLGRGGSWNADSAGKYSDIFFASTNLDPYTGRYEALKSSGKFGIVENRALLEDIITLHETIIKRIEYLNDMYYRQNLRLGDLISQRIQIGRDGKTKNAETIVRRSDFRMLLSLNEGLIAGNIIPIHEAGIKMCNEIIGEIDRELK